MVAADLILPYWNREELVRQCLRSLVAAGVGDRRVVVVDDGSSPQQRASVDRELARLPLRAQVVTHDTNRGYKEAIHSGVEVCSAPYLVLLNSDSILTPGFVEALVGVMEDRPEVAAVAPVSNHPTDLFQFRKELYLDPRDPRDAARLLRDVFGLTLRAKKRRPRVTTAPYLTGMCLALRRELFKELGGFGAHYLHGYFEDMALSCRLRDLGHTLAIREDCFVYHQGHGTYRDKPSEEKQRIIHHNFAIFARDWGHLPEHPSLLRLMEHAGREFPV